MAMNYSLYVLVLACIFMIIITPAHLQGYGVPPGTNSPPATASPPNGYQHVPNHGYYKLHPQLVGWHLAYDVCRWELAQLFIANSESEAKNVSKLATSGNWFWIGYCDLFDEGNYVTIYNQTEKDAGYDKVAPGEQNGGVGESCGRMKNDGLLANHWCTEQQAFMCEYLGY